MSAFACVVIRSTYYNNSLGNPHNKISIECTWTQHVYNYIIIFITHFPQCRTHARTMRDWTIVQCQWTSYADMVIVKLYSHKQKQLECSIEEEYTIGKSYNHKNNNCPYRSQTQGAMPSNNVLLGVHNKEQLSPHYLLMQCRG